MKLIDTGWPLIELGYGRIEVADGTHEGKPALIFGRNGMGKIGEPTQPDRRHEPGETLAVITFTNVESLDVVAEELAQIRTQLSGAAQETGAAPLAQQLRNAAAVSDLSGFLATHKVKGVVSGSELEESIRRARAEIASWPDSVKRAMGVPLASSQWSPDAEYPTVNRGV
jgi:hypothetical protein